MKAIFTGIVISVFGGLILWGIQLFFTDEKVYVLSNNGANSYLTTKIYDNATLSISGTNSDVEIHESKSGMPLQDSSISSTNSEQVLYLPKGQSLLVNITGINSDLRISKSIAEQVNVNNSGTNSDVILF